MRRGLSRRGALGAGAGALVLVTLRPARSQALRVEPGATEAAIARFTGGRAVTPGRVVMEIPPLVENGASAPLRLDVGGPFAEGVFVRRIGVFNEKNPLPDVVTLHLGPRTPPRVSTRIRLAASQTLTAIAELSDGALFSATADVSVTLAACLDE